MKGKHTHYTSAPLTDDELVSFSAMLDGIAAVIQSGTVSATDLNLLGRTLDQTPNKFWPVFLKVSGRCSRKRDAALSEMLGQIQGPLRALFPETYPTLPSEDLDGLIAHLAGRLDDYTGPLDTDDFMRWAIIKVVHPQAGRLLAFYRIREQGLKAAYGGAIDILKTCPDLGADEATADEIVHDALVKIYADIDEWAKPGTAKISTRLYSFARSQARSWRTARLRERARFTDLGAVDPTLRDAREDMAA